MPVTIAPKVAMPWPSIWARCADVNEPAGRIAVRTTFANTPPKISITPHHHNGCFLPAMVLPSYRDNWSP